MQVNTASTRQQQWRHIRDCNRRSACCSSCKQ